MFEIEKQHYLLNSLISSHDLIALTIGILKPEYFEPRYRSAAKFILDYANEYRDVPTEELVRVETGVELTKKQLSRAEMEHDSKSIETFCRWCAIEKVIMHGANLLGDIDTDKDKKFGELDSMMKNAIAVSLQKDLGISYFEDPHRRMEDMAKNAIPIPTGWVGLDDIIGGGINRKELFLFAANSGVGKSIFMANLSVNLMEAGYNVLYISLELADLLVSKRFDAMITGVPYAEHKNRSREIADQVIIKGQSMADLTIKRMRESVTTANDLRAYLKEYELTKGFLPDVLVVDYLDLMASNRNISVENVFIKDKFIAEEVRSLADEFNMMAISASQLGRQAMETKDHHQGHIQGGISKVNTTDNLVAILQDETNKAAGEFILKGLKTRNSGGVGKTCILKWNQAILRVTEQDTLKLNTPKPRSDRVLSDMGTAFDHPASQVKSILDNLPKL